MKISFLQTATFKVFHKHISHLEDTPERTVLTRVLALYGGNLLIRHLGLLYEVI